MENLASFLIGMGFPVATFLVSVMMIAGGTEQGAPAKAMAFLTLAGVISWIVIFSSWGISAGFIAFGGWVAGVGIALVLMQITGKIRRKQLGFKDSNFK